MEVNIMAEKKDENKKKTTHTRSVWSLNKISFYLIVAIAILHLVAMILSCVGLGRPVSILQGIANAIMICVVAVLAYRFVRNKPTVWLVLYIVVLLVVLVGIVIPLIVLW